MTLKDQDKLIDELNIGVIGTLFWYSISAGTWEKGAVDEALINADIARKFSARFSNRRNFLRAMKHLEKQGLLRKVYDNEDELCYQLTEEKHEEFGVGLEYHKKAIIQYFKESGDIEASDDTIYDIVLKAYKEEGEMYRDTDIRNLIRSILTRAGHAIKPRSGVYFVPEAKKYEVEKIVTFLTEINAHQGIGHFSVADLGDAKQQLSQIYSKEAQKKLAELIEEINKLSEKEVSSKVLARRYKKINDLRNMIDVYSQALSIQSEEIANALTKAEDTLKDAMGLATTRDENKPKTKAIEIDEPLSLETPDWLADVHNEPLLTVPEQETEQKTDSSESNESESISLDFDIPDFLDE